MRVTHVISSISKKGGGTSTYLQSLLNSFDSSVKNTLVCFESKDSLELNNNISSVFIPQSTKKINGFSKLFKSKFYGLTNDVFHGNGMWSFPTHLMSKFARKNNVPYIISPHGMLEPWSLGQSKLKKKIVFNLYQKKDIRLSSCIHATAVSEAKNIRDLGFENPIAIIPNGVKIDDFPNKALEKSTSQKRILFLSRIHPKKGIENLINAWSQIEKELKHNWVVDIVGNGDEHYIFGLKELIDKKKLDKEIFIKPPIFGNEKINLFYEANLFILPTFSENFGIVIAEALASFTPVITTKGTPWEDLEKYKCGKWIDIGVLPLKLAIQDMLSLKEKELFDMGINGRKLVERKYSMKSVSDKMLNLYKWVLGETIDKPSFVQLNKNIK